MLEPCWHLRGSFSDLPADLAVEYSQGSRFFASLPYEAQAECGTSLGYFASAREAASAVARHTPGVAVGSARQVASIGGLVEPLLIVEPGSLIAWRAAAA